MADALLSARIVRFDHGHGFGSVLVDDGREVPFDVTVCLREPSMGEEARVRLGRRGDGSLRVVFLEPVASPEPEIEGLPVRAALMRLQDAGLATGLTFEKLDALVDARFGGDEDEADIVSVLAEYYRGADRAAIADGWFHCDWKFENDTDDICAELSARVGAPALLTLTAWQERDSDELGYVETVATLRARRFDGREEVRDIRSVLDVVSLFNQVLRERQDSRQFRSLETDGDWYAFVLLAAETRERLALWRALPFDRE